MKILGIESSCDETACAVINIKARSRVFSLLSHNVFSQIKIHKKYGGVVPEVAARDHVVKIIPVIKKTLTNAGISLDDIDAIAFTKTPGLITSLLVGKYTADALGYVLDIPVLGVNHIHSHMLSSLINNGQGKLSIKEQVLVLVVSGGHTQLYLMNPDFSYKCIGKTRDDAAGEAFDKTAKIMGLEYPGGPIIAKLAKHGNAQAFNLPRPMINSNDFDFSFSGLKTAVLYLVNGLPLKKDSTIGKNKKNNKFKALTMNKRNIFNLSASIQQAIVDVLVSKTLKAVKKYKVKSVFLAGGVSANDKLRYDLELALKEQDICLYKPEKEFCTDNAVMVALAGAVLLLKK